MQEGDKETRLGVAATGREVVEAGRVGPDVSPAESFSDGLLAAHWAAQIVSAAGWTLAAPEADDSHGSLEWAEAEGALLGVVVARGEKRARAGLRLGDLTLLALADDGGPREMLALPGTTLDAGLAWLAGALARILATPVPRLERPRHELPSHSVGDGAPFGGQDGAALATLGRWFSSADQRLRALVASTPAASPVRCWPHHFDIATLIRLESAGAHQEIPRSIGVGMSPGDGSYPEPYWYVTPWPYPDASVAAAAVLPAGHWHTQGWFGAVLTASELAADTAAAAGPRLATFLATAVAACRAI